MKAFLKNVAVFLLIPLLVVVTIDLWLRSINSLYKEKYEGLLKKKDFIEVLILGNSYAHYGVDPNQFTFYAYNLANVGQSIYFDKRLTLRVLDDLPKLKYVLISIDYHSLSFSSQEARNYWSYYGHGLKYKDLSYFKADLSPFLFGYTPLISLSLIKKSLIKYILYHDQDVIDFDVENGVDIFDSIKNGFIPLQGRNEHV